MEGLSLSSPHGCWMAIQPLASDSRCGNTCCSDLKNPCASVHDRSVHDRIGAHTWGTMFSQLYLKDVQPRSGKQVITMVTRGLTHVFPVATMPITY